MVDDLDQSKHPEQHGQSQHQPRPAGYRVDALAARIETVADRDLGAIDFRIPEVQYHIYIV